MSNSSNNASSTLTDEVTQVLHHSTPEPTLIYKNWDCNCGNGWYKQTAIDTATGEPNHGKLFHFCSSCVLVHGWCLPMAYVPYANRDAYLTAAYAQGIPPMTANSPCRFKYNRLQCECGVDCFLHVSENDATLGRLYYRCDTCNVFKMWAVPIDEGV